MAEVPRSQFDQFVDDNPSVEIVLPDGGRWTLDKFRAIGFALCGHARTSTDEEKMDFTRRLLPADASLTPDWAWLLEDGAQDG